jgi:4-hydroxybenzoate polyprenyltransferase
VTATAGERLPAPGAVAELVRLPAVLSVPGDVLVGAAFDGRASDLGRATGMAAASSCLYLAGMALNDYADREIDAVERPHRPIPSGRVEPGFALGLAGGLTVAGAALAVAADGSRALRVVLPLAASVWAYDLALKGTPAGVAGMSACRSLDVLMGAGARGARRALPAAAIVGAHTATVTAVSRHEAAGGGSRTARRALAATGGVAAAALALAARRSRSAAPRVLSLGLLGAYAVAVGGAQADAARDPSPARMQRAVGSGVLGLMPLEAGLLAGANRPARALGVAALWPLARALARRKAVT